MDFEVAIVTDVVLDSTSQYFGNVGGYNGIGAIAFQKIKGGNYKSRGFAKPYFSNFSNYPLKNELVYIFSLPSPDIQKSNYQLVHYYITPINIWNSNHHNGIPNIFENKDLPDSQKRDYTQTSLGSVRRVEDGSSDIDLGNTFQEKSSIKPLYKYEGDVTLEGRFGNSIRFGSTVLSGSQPLNNWSTDGINGDPILILRNGQGDTGSAGFLPTSENINVDPSSIYLTTSQKLPIVLPKFNYSSYNSSPPTSPSEYNKNQIVIKSGRLILGSSNDHIILSSKKSINLSAVESINLESNSDIILDAIKIYLGDKDATEPLLKGDTTEALLKELISIVQQLIIGSQSAANAGGPIPSLNSIAPNLLTRIQKLSTSNIKSQYSFTR
jgi:hypothetical protein